MQRGLILRTGLCLALFVLPIKSTPSSAVSLTPTATCVSSTCTVTFVYTGDYYSWTVPVGVSSIAVDAFGAQGGKSNYTGNSTAVPGSGGRVQASLTTTSGETLHIYVGGQGSPASVGSNTSSPGWNGGGKGGQGNGTGYYGAGGGGATDIRTTAGNLSTRILVAGGGGGTSCNGCVPNDNGGNGGGLIAAEGALAANGSVKSGGGTQSAGGTGNTYSGWGASQAGSLGLGGNAQASDASINGGGGGGGGYYGGGGGSWVGGGGGSSFTNATRASAITHTSGSRTGNGLMTITYSEAKVATTTALSLAGNVTSVEKRKAINLTATVTVAGKVTFFSNGKRIAGCVKKVAASTTAVCSVKASVTGKAIYTASYTPTSASYLSSTSAPLEVNVVRRTGAR
jgi:hypothetical protein